MGYLRKLNLFSLLNIITLNECLEYWESMLGIHFEVVMTLVYSSYLYFISWPSFIDVIS